MDASSSSRTRRSSDEIRSLLLNAARELFIANGYAGTTTIDISRKAGVTEKLLFNNFGSKAELFDAAILSGLAEFVERYRVAWEKQSADSTPEERVELLVRGLFELAEENRAILRSALSRPQSGGDDPQAQLVRHWAETLQSWEDLAASVRDDSGLAIDPPASIAAAGSMVFGMALLDDLLFPEGSPKPSRERRIAAMTDLALHGLLHKRS